MNWLKEFHNYLQLASRFWVENEARCYAFLTEKEYQSTKRKQKQLKDRRARIMKTIMDGQIHSRHCFEDQRHVDYICHLRHLIKQGELFYIEEAIQKRRATFKQEKLHSDEFLTTENQKPSALAALKGDQNPSKRSGFSYQRLQAVRYADAWWNGHNPDYRTFDVDCTNYVSQCLRAGGAPMRGAPQRDRGWWYGGGDEQWSYSWAVAHSLRWYLSESKSGLQAQEMNTADELRPGDVICYDFDGDGSWQHNAIVTAKDADGMPLVNAHTVNRRRHYWAYDDSVAWTPNIQYKFFRIADHS